ncbi:class I SAM-dependent methyltransferase [Tolypothrix sp. PCC 7910]|uniref:class I SAM-dependent methyltransferase n=1 Tax=Tolypothrix sp. PCC 7910 TaxID=2099387 RepID=UPI0014277495|nr:methyltransferase domain-containing protein [Tolypothrix sp. PCC 7910]QIR37982.1 class I SAM-dependent methyltransferase [Tolypothrix sp. PCC 7910]
MSNVSISQIDTENLKLIRHNVVEFMKYISANYAKHSGRLLDIAPQAHEGAQPFFEDSILIDTFDINPQSGCTYIGDICKFNSSIPNETYDYIVCTEVLEHTLQPFNAVNEMWRILKAGGLLFVSTPFNFRIHGPLPDCWRFTEHGLRALLNRFLIVELNKIETLDRALMPIQYTVIAQKIKDT